MKFETGDVVVAKGIILEGVYEFVSYGFGGLVWLTNDFADTEISVPEEKIELVCKYKDRADVGEDEK